MKTNFDPVDVWFGFLPGLIGYAVFVSWADVIVRAIRGEESEDNWKTRLSSAALIAIRTLISGTRVREMASLRGAAVEMRRLVDHEAAQAALREQRAAKRDRLDAEQQARLLMLTKWLVGLAALTLAAALVTLAVAIAS